jgi:AcrR family transcriptional regulator
MTVAVSSESTRRAELLSAAYEYVLDHGVADLTLRPLASAIGSSPRVLLYLFESKEGLVREVLARARNEELAHLREWHGSRQASLSDNLDRLWDWLADERHRRLLTLWVEGYARSLADPAGPWRGFAQRTVDDWLDLLAGVQPTRRRNTPAGRAERTLALTVMRGALLDLLATGDVDRVTAGVRAFTASLR